MLNFNNFKDIFFTLHLIDMAAFNQISSLHSKKYLLCTLLILKRIKFAKKRRKRICWIRGIGSSCQQILLNIGVFENFENFTTKYLCWSLFFNKVDDLQLYQKRLHHRCFPVKFEKFLITALFTEHLWWVFLENYLDCPEKGGYTQW